MPQVNQLISVKPMKLTGFGNELIVLLQNPGK